MEVLKISPAQTLLDQLTGAQIVCASVEDGDGMHVMFADGRTWVIVGEFAMSLLKSEKLH